MPKIKVTKISGPTKKEIKVRCPSCGTLLSRDPPINQKSGKETCGICGTEFKWGEVK